MFESQVRVVERTEERSIPLTSRFWLFGRVPRMTCLYVICIITLIGIGGEGGMGMGEGLSGREKNVFEGGRA